MKLSSNILVSNSPLFARLGLKRTEFVNEMQVVYISPLVAEKIKILFNN